MMEDQNDNIDEVELVDNTFKSFTVIRRSFRKKDMVVISTTESEYPEKMGPTSVRYSTRPNTMLGQGCSGHVYPGYHAGLNVEAAVKWIREDSLKKNKGNFVEELEILRGLKDNMGFIQLLDSYRVEDVGLFIALEKAEMTFYTAITTTNVEREVILTWLEQVSNALDYLHNDERNIIHRDIKPANILIVRTKDNVWVAKLSDFGLSRVISGKQSQSGTECTAKGTFPYMAPEIMMAENEKFLTKKTIDIFALGMTMYFGLSNGKHPFSAGSDIAMRERIRKVTDKPDKLNKEEFAANDLLGKMMEKVAENRPNMKQVISHCLFWDWKKKNDFLFDVARCMDIENPNELVKNNKDRLEQVYRVSHVKIRRESFNWLNKLDANLRQVLLYHSGKERKYGDGQSICQLIKLFRDKYAHFTSMMENNSTDENIFFESGTFKEKVYFHFFLELAPNITDVLFCTIRDLNVDVTFSLVKDKYYRSS